jgi:Fe-S cluster assembly protein SufD
MIMIVKRKTTQKDLSLQESEIRAISAKLNDANWYAEQRLQAWQAYQATAMPTTQDEAWRRTDISKLNWQKVQHPVLANTLPSKSEVPPELLRPLVGDEHGGQLVIRGGQVEQANLAANLAQQGVIFTDFLTATREHGNLLQKYLGKAVKTDDGKFTLLTAALVDQGIFVYVPKHTKVEMPLHSVIWADGSAHFSRVVVVADDGAELTYVHELGSAEGSEQAFHSGTVEVFCGANANLQFIELQSLGQHFWHFSHERCQVGRDGKLDWIFSGLGSHVTKNFSDLDLVGSGAWCRMSGFYFAEKDQHLDHDTQQNHLVPHTTSDLLFKGALLDDSRSVWQGMIYVAPGAQKTDGFQANRNLILSKKARADSIPGLEILADDVRCTHAAAVGQLEPHHMFYLMSRGLPYEEAKRIIVEGFYDPILQRIPFEGVRDRLLSFISEKI